MREMNTDLRVIRTKESIRNALVELIEDNGFEAITVKDITTRARINRGTFYTHYQDKFDLMTKCQEDLMHEMADIVQKNLPDQFEDPGINFLASKPFSVAVLIFEYLDTNRDFLKAVLGPKGDINFLTKLKEFMWKNLFDSKNGPLNKLNMLVPAEYLVSYISSAHMGVIQQWLLGDRKETPQEMATILSTITLEGPLFAAGLKKK
ncbi:TetR/AcrR family transcriptional regulator [Paenibacillus sp. D2_2]|uniref:TetR/AcrR family transcriptional regulator n=1 Tax=Paenibacillus sp. D2_2 TaxID=3073092 RepID=UPI0028157F09|nr:TetR/AcrR family transcriptional regulator [Paenibacillus sp. D2_2]WMT43181.1 TetR/AcrR family transcriptional regulator [Paenibacillus sp. D2_2]